MWGSTALNERYCKGIREILFEMAGIAPADIINTRVIQRHRVDSISRKNDSGLDVLGEATQPSLYTWRIGTHKGRPADLNASKA